VFHEERCNTQPAGPTQTAEWRVVKISKTCANETGPAVCSAKRAAPAVQWSVFSNTLMLGWDLLKKRL
jgi:hypothetical protein